MMWDGGGEPQRPLTDKEKLDTFHDFYKKLSENQVEVSKEMADIVQEYFWDLI